MSTSRIPTLLKLSASDRNKFACSRSISIRFMAARSSALRRHLRFAVQLFFDFRDDAVDGFTRLLVRYHAPDPPVLGDPLAQPVNDSRVLHAAKSALLEESALIYLNRAPASAQPQAHG
jgi:hypothetical protein